MDPSFQAGEVTVAKFNVKDKSLYVKVSWEKDDEVLFTITVFYEDSSWKGKYSTVAAAQRRERLDETEEEYNKNVKNFLSDDCKDCSYDFTLNPDDLNSANFIWRKQYEGSIKKLHGTVSIQRDAVPTSKDTLIDILLEKNKNLLSEVELAKDTNNGLKQHLEEYIQRLEELTESKIMLESTLYGRFVQVLNEKKRRIQLLEDRLKSFKVPE